MLIWHIVDQWPAALPVVAGLKIWSGDVHCTPYPHPSVLSFSLSLHPLLLGRRLDLAETLLTGPLNDNTNKQAKQTQCKKESKDQESLQSSNTLDPGHHMGK